MDQILNLIFLGNSIFAYIVAVDIFLACLVVVFLAHQILMHKLANFVTKTESKIYNLLYNLISQVGWSVYIITALNVGILALNVNVWISRILAISTIIFLVFYSLKSVNQLVVFWVTHITNEDEPNQQLNSKSIANLSGILAQLCVWVVAIVWILVILEIDISSLVGTLGIGGIAIAFALQSILSDIFASFSIYFDRPFEVGDFIQIGVDSGTVQKIGVKSTRIKTLQGEMMVLPNKELTGLRVQNFSHFENRRGKINFSLDFKTNNKQIKEVLKTLETIIKTQKDTEFSRCNFCGFGNYGLDIEAIYYISDSDYTVFMNTQEKIYLSLKEFLDLKNIKIVHTLTFFEKTSSTY